MQTFKGICIVLSIALWSTYLFVDKAYLSVLKEAVENSEGTYGESYGYLGYWRLITGYFAFGLACIAMGLGWKQ